jgi:hypothetical protein
MATNQNALNREIDGLWSEVARLRDETRVRLHLGAMDARDAFAQIEREVEHTARDASQATKRVLDNARTQLRELRDGLRDAAESPTAKSP